jgi:hypothetical protein
MRPAIVVIASVLSLLAKTALAQPAAPPADWKAWSSLVGEWVADPTPGGPTGSFTFALDLQNRVLVRKSFAEYPKSKDRPAQRHDDLMVVFQEGDATGASYFDNEGHVIRYHVTVSKNAFVFLSEPQKGQPRFRLTYTIKSPTTLALSFDIAMPNAPDAFRPYIQSTATKKK